MGGSEDLAERGERRLVWGNTRKIEHLEVVGIDGRIILNGS
jgi:hypothetical protein